MPILTSLGFSINLVIAYALMNSWLSEDGKEENGIVTFLSLLVVSLPVEVWFFVDNGLKGVVFFLLTTCFNFGICVIKSLLSKKSDCHMILLLLLT